MKCCYLSVYSSELFTWQVAACKARQGRYVPSLSDLENLCRKDHTGCPFYLTARMIELEPLQQCDAVTTCVS
ncbi:MAG: hypothetical protein V1706_13650 [Pseudomonadota bacterium]